MGRRRIAADKAHALELPLLDERLHFFGWLGFWRRNIDQRHAQNHGERNADHPGKKQSARRA